MQLNLTASVVVLLALFSQGVCSETIAGASYKDVCKKMELSMRSYHKIWRVALTIAYLEHAEVPSAPDGHAEQPSPPTDLMQQHFIEALSYRTMTWSGQD